MTVAVTEERVLGTLVSVQRGDSRFHPVRDMATLGLEVSH